MYLHQEEDDAAANAAVAAAVAAPSGRRQPKRVSTPPKASAAAAAVAAAIIEQHMISPPSIAAQMAASLTNVVTAALASTPTTSGGGNKTTTNISDPRYRKPFTFGWKRELVYRAHNDVHRKQYDKAEVYYITPGNKKLRTRADILMNLTEGLDANDFTFAREPIGMSAEEEIIRSAKLQTPSSKHRPVNFLDLGEADPMLGFGKRVPKPKMPKGASPPPQLPPLPASLSVTLLQSPSTSGLLGKQAGSRVSQLWGLFVVAQCSSLNRRVFQFVEHAGQQTDGRRHGEGGGQVAEGLKSQVSVVDEVVPLTSHDRKPIR